MDINVLVDEEFKGKVQEIWLKNVARELLAAQGISPNAEISLVITGQEKIHQLNLSYLGEDRPTDVLSFSMLPGQARSDIPQFVAPPDGLLHLGEVIISYPQATTQAEEHHHPVKKEIAILLIHGILHILGYDHAEPEEEQAMKTKEAEMMGRIEGELG